MKNTEYLLQKTRRVGRHQRCQGMEVSGSRTARCEFCRQGGKEESRKFSSVQHRYGMYQQRSRMATWCNHRDASDTLDPQIGVCWTDGPNTSWVAVLVAVTQTVSLDMSDETFHVSAAFLREVPIE